MAELKYDPCDYSDEEILEKLYEYRPKDDYQLECFFRDIEIFTLWKYKTLDRHKILVKYGISESKFTNAIIKMCKRYDAIKNGATRDDLYKKQGGYYRERFRDPDMMFVASILKCECPYMSNSQKQKLRNKQAYERECKMFNEWVRGMLIEELAKKYDLSSSMAYQIIRRHCKRVLKYAEEMENK